MVGYLVLHDFQAQFVGLAHQLLHVRQRAEMVFDAIVINRAVAVIARHRTPGLVASDGFIGIVVPGRKPQRRHA